MRLGDPDVELGVGVSRYQQRERFDKTDKRHLGLVSVCDVLTLIALVNVLNPFVVPNFDFIVSATSRYQIQVRRNIPTNNVFTVGFGSATQSGSRLAILLVFSIALFPWVQVGVNSGFVRIFGRPVSQV